MGHSYAGAGGVGTFTVTPSFTGSPTRVKFTLSHETGDTGGNVASHLTTSKEIRSVIGSAIDAWISTNTAQLATNGVTVGNESTDDFGGSNTLPHSVGDGFYGFRWNFAGLTAETPSIVTTSLTDAAITASIPFADTI